MAALRWYCCSNLRWLLLPLAIAGLHKRACHFAILLIALSNSCFMPRCSLTHSITASIALKRDPLGNECLTDTLQFALAAPACLGLQPYAFQPTNHISSAVCGGSPRPCHSSSCHPSPSDEANTVCAEEYTIILRGHLSCLP